MTERLDLRAGLMVDTSPVNKNYYNPETPGMTKVEPTVGLSFRPIPQLSIDLGFMYVAGMGIDNASCQYADLLGTRERSVNLPQPACPSSRSKPSVSAQQEHSKPTTSSTPSSPRSA